MGEMGVLSGKELKLGATMLWQQIFLHPIIVSYMNLARVFERWIFNVILNRAIKKTKKEEFCLYNLKQFTGIYI